MITVDEAYRLIYANRKEFATETIPLLQAINRTLATDVRADRDFPPFDRITMDGIAINSKLFEAGKRHFQIEKISAAGSPVQSLNNSEHCIEVMTGAVLPMNTDVVIPYEQCNIHNGIAEVTIETVKQHQNIHKQGSDEKSGAILLEKNNRITPAYINIMATVGMSNVEVYKLPSVAVCSTGDELITITETPLPHQVRQSNVYLLAANLQTENIAASLHHLPDDKEKMKQQLALILQSHDVVLLSGAVSKGKFDFLPQVLTELDMQTVFHGISQRPGKPFLFGNINHKLIFGFPGNPLSTFVCYHLYFLYWLHQCLHQPVTKIMAKLSANVPVQSLLTQHILVSVKYKEGCCFVEPILASTSGDIPAMIQADGIISLPAGKDDFEKEEGYEVLLCT